MTVCYMLDVASFTMVWDMQVSIEHGNTPMKSPPTQQQLLLQQQQQQAQQSTGQPNQGGGKVSGCVRSVFSRVLCEMLVVLGY